MVRLSVGALSNSYCNIVLGAVKSGTAYIQDAIQSSLASLGQGAGPVNHFHNIHSRPYTGYHIYPFFLTSALTYCISIARVL